MSDKLEAYNNEVRDRWIAKSLGVGYLALKKHVFFVSSDENSLDLIVTFIPATDPNLMKRCKGFDGTNIFRVSNT